MKTNKKRRIIRIGPETLYGRVLAAERGVKLHPRWRLMNRGTWYFRGKRARPGINPAQVLIEAGAVRRSYPWWSFDDRLMCSSFPNRWARL